jgi:hypothetical protein
MKTEMKSPILEIASASTSAPLMRRSSALLRRLL